MTPAPRWRVERRTGTAGALHELTLPDQPARTLRILTVERPALVLGSAQRDDLVDRGAAEAAGVEIAHRRSGGGAVLLRPGEHVWVDLWLPAGDPLWVDDVIRAADWVGKAWATALTALGFASLAVHRGPHTDAGGDARVCFSGRGPGEVLRGERKLVGLSQRRSREWLRYQTLVHRRWDAAATLALLAGTPATAGEITALQARVAEVGEHDVVSALVAALRA